MELVIVETVEIAAPRERVFDFITSPGAVAQTFEGHGPIPAAVKSEAVDGGALRVGSIRRVTSADGSVIDEEITALERPALQRYRLLGGLRGIGRWIVRGAHGHWTLEPRGESTFVTWTFTFELRGFVAWPFAAAMRRPFRRAMQKALAKTAKLVAG